MKASLEYRWAGPYLHRTGKENIYWIVPQQLAIDGQDKGKARGKEGVDRKGRQEGRG